MSVRVRLLPALLVAVTALALPPSVSAHNGPHDEQTPSYQSIDQLGRLSFPTSTRNPAAQTAFVRGMLLMHLFEYPAAKEAFLEAQKLDPDFVMAYWGEAMCATHPAWNQQDMEAGRSALAKIGPTPEARAAKAPSLREKGWLELAEILYGEGSKRERDARFADAAGRLAARFPQDDEAKLFHALALLGKNQSERDLKDFLEAARISQSVYLVNPEHPGAAHYWIHGMDDPAHAEGALEAARALSKIAPAAGHAQHMTSHIFIALGMWDDLVTANENAQRVVAAELARQGQPDYRCGHYPEWLEYGYFQQGRERDALQVLADCESQGPAAVAWFREHPAPRYGAATTPEKLQGRIESSLVWMRGMAVMDSHEYMADYAKRADEGADPAGDKGAARFAKGFAQARTGDVAGAESNLARLRAEIAALGDSEEKRTSRNYLKVMALMLEAALGEAGGKTDLALAKAREAAAIYDAIPFDYGPPSSMKPPHELAGEILLAAGRPKEAVGEFDIALEWAPRRAASLLGRARALAASGSTAAQAEYEQLDAMWHAADPERRALLERPVR